MGIRKTQLYVCSHLDAMRHLCHQRFIRRGLAPTIFAIFTLLLLLHATLPLDSGVRSVVRFNTAKLRYYLQGTGPSRDAWLTHDGLFHNSPSYPLNESSPGGDVGIVIKTSYGSRRRIPTQLEALGLATHEKRLVDGPRLRNGSLSKTLKDFIVPDDEKFIVVADFAPAEEERFEGVEIIDGMQAMMDRMSPRIWNHPRFVKYGGMEVAVQEGYHDKAASFSLAYGWEFDAAKFIVGLELAWERMPNRKWYVIINDNTFLVQTSLRLLLNKLDHTKPLYIGKPVGDYKGRFAHTGGAIILSSEAVRRLVSREGAMVLDETHHRCLDELFGDKLLGEAMQKLGIYLEEDYAHFFNGEQPRHSKIRPDRFCAPLISFYGMSSVGKNDMRSVGMMLHNTKEVVRWADMWHLFGLPNMKIMKPGLVRVDRDHITDRDQGTQFRDVRSANACWEVCRTQGGRNCVAWTWDKAASICYTAPWFTVGEKVNGLQSGLNAHRVQELWDQCH